MSEKFHNKNLEVKLGESRIKSDYYVNKEKFEKEHTLNWLVRDRSKIACKVGLNLSAGEVKRFNGSISVFSLLNVFTTVKKQDS